MHLRLRLRHDSVVLAGFLDHRSNFEVPKNVLKSARNLCYKMLDPKCRIQVIILKRPMLFSSA